MQSTYTYKSILHDAIKVNWQVADLIGGDKQLDFTKPFLPEALVGSDAIECLILPVRVSNHAKKLPSRF